MLGCTEFVKQATQQLTALFGEQAKNPRAVYFQDWSNEVFTASAGDQKPQAHHPRYGLSLQLGNDWEGRLEFIASETTFGNGGLIEGALESGLGYSRRVTGTDLLLND